MPERVFIDQGGTFTDVVRVDASGAVHVEKLLNARGRNERPVAIDALEGREVSELRMGTTVATNALLERRGERVLLLITRGFADLLEIGHQDRPDIFALDIVKRESLAAEVRELDERVLADGTVRTPLRDDDVRAALEGFDCVAVVLLHAHAYPEHERRIGELARAAGYRHVALSHEVAPQIGAVGRGDTTVADAYLTPLLRRFVDAVQAAAPSSRALFMQSSGGLADAHAVSGKDAVLSGPAGGVVAVAETARRAGVRSVVGLDMGGTSTDVCRVHDGVCARTFETVVDGVRLRAPMLSVETVAAGGGSILRHQDGRYLVGPQSAGADPGPACYGRGGPATITDANLVVGNLRPEHFPHLALDVDAARARLSELAVDGASAEQTAAAFLTLADETMAAAIRRVATARGHDVRGDALCAFGGAAGQHACAIAERLGVTTVIVPPFAGVLSAYGMGLADIVHHEVVSVGPIRVEPEDDAGAVDVELPLECARRAIATQGVDDPTFELSIDARTAGTDDTITVAWTPAWREEFTAEHRRRFGFAPTDAALEITTARVAAIGRTTKLAPPEMHATPHAAEAHEQAPAIVATRTIERPVYRQCDLAPGATLSGPALIVDDLATVVVAPHWHARIDHHGHVILERDGRRHSALSALSDPQPRDPLGLEVMSHRFMAIAVRMGDQLRRVAHSTNIKERLDFSCAVFDGEGQLVANAPHIPVHLGAMGVTVRSLLAARTMRAGDAWLTNDPYAGGSHLPDLTVITPVFRDDTLAFFVANRGHHADIGGIVPGSMPAHSTSIHEEGALFTHELIVRDGRLLVDKLVGHFEGGGVRGIPERLGDLRAQVAANTTGAALLDELCAELETPAQPGLAAVGRWMELVADNAAEVMQDVVATLRPGSFFDTLDDGSRIAVEIRREGDRAVIDFAGTSPQQNGNRNAPRAVTIAAVLYVFRTLARRAIPLNAGCLRPLDIRIPEGSLLAPRSPAAVVGGNVETSQRVVDVLLAALGEQAACQGTMNNLTFGDATFAYYETLCGGAGATPRAAGASAVHTHMTNTRLTDVEVLESRYPVVVRRFAIRAGSGGDGERRGGDGVVREIEFLRPLEVSFLGERRRTRPFGLAGGSAGSAGTITITPRSVLVETPGGGGYGNASPG